MFTKFEARFQKNIAYFNVNKNNCVISKSAYKIIGEPKKANIYYDIENKEIKLEPNQETGQPIHCYPRQVFITGKLSTYMPLGRYYWKNQTKTFKKTN